MKVFEFDPVTGRRGAQIADIAAPQFVANPGFAKCKLPKATRDSDWRVATLATGKNNEAIVFDRPVCYCLGQWTAGTDTTWQWVAHLPSN